MILNFERAGDIDTSNLHYKILLYGKSGAGKTYAAATAPNCCFLLTERNGQQSIRISNPDAVIAYCPTAEKVRAFMRMAVKGELPDGIRTIVLDGLTELQKIFQDEILAGKDAQNRHMTKQDWGTLTEKMRLFMRTLRDLEYHVVATALSDESQADGDGAIRYVQPSFSGRKLPQEIAQFFNGCGYVFKKAKADENGKEEIFHRIMFAGPSRFTVQPCYPLGGIQEPDLSTWFDQLASAGAPDKAGKADKTKTKTKAGKAEDSKGVAA